MTESWQKPNGPFMVSQHEPNSDVKDTKNCQMPQVTPEQKWVVCTWGDTGKKKKKIDLSHSVTLLVPAKSYRAEHREEFPRARISSCCLMLGQQACPHPLASFIFLRMWWGGRLTSLESVRHPKPCCRLPGMWDAVSIYHSLYPWKHKRSKAIPVTVSSGLKSPSDRTFIIANTP